LWVEQDRVEKQETTEASFCTWVEEEFLDLFLDWVKGKIISRIPDQDRVMFEMTCPADCVRGKTHVEVIVHKGFPLPSFVP
jgi:hypothetical protein